MDKVLREYVKKLRNVINSKFKYENSGHDVYHLNRVAKLAYDICTKEGGDMQVVVVSALLHDIHRSIEKQTGKICKPEESLDEVIEIIQSLDLNLNSEQFEKVIHTIKYHEGYPPKVKDEEKIKETLIVQDADRLDELGAIGIGRIFTFGGYYKSPIWDPDIPLKERRFWECENIAPTTMHFIVSKICLVKNNINTDRGKEIAKERAKFTDEFVTRFLEEWDGMDYINEKIYEDEL